METKNEPPENQLAVLMAGGAEKNWKPQYIFSLLLRCDKSGDRIADANDIGKITAERDLCINFIPEARVKAELRQEADDLIVELNEQVRAENMGKITDTQKINNHRIAAVRCIGKVKEYFDSCWGWARKRGVMIAGPFGDDRRRFIPLSKLPEDGKYINKATGKEVDFDLNSILYNNKGRAIDEARSAGDEEQDIVEGEVPAIDGGVSTE
ncbi:hypothetical protein [Methanocella sp. MCL-LM]|uniref:hypothetical protein n=1 Tax=Methanocella sp. MCL-LM TaxID=3412035 RepID=UPI003C72764E